MYDRFSGNSVEYKCADVMRAMKEAHRIFIGDKLPQEKIDNYFRWFNSIENAFQEYTWRLICAEYKNGKTNLDIAWELDKTTDAVRAYVRRHVERLIKTRKYVIINFMHAFNECLISLK